MWLVRKLPGWRCPALACCWLCGSLALLSAADTGQSWAWRSPALPQVPAVKQRDWVRNPIDAFILAKLEGAGLQPAPAADRAVLLRRLSFDLTGLPPTPAEVEAFVNDASPDAYEKVVERLLASPQYGEHWAMYWLDLVRYAESDGFKADDARPEAWRYRDYVIRSLNSDKPYDRFLREQLAGDELYPEDGDALLATAYNRHYPDEYNAVNLEQRRQEILNDLTDTTGQVFLGLTLGCARCHDHKFDPISQADYYRFQSFFAAFQPIDVPTGSSEEVQRYHQRLRKWETQTASLRRRLDELEAPYRRQVQDKRKARFSQEYQDIYDLPAAQRTPLQQQLAAMVAKQVPLKPDDVAKLMPPDVRRQWDDLSQQLRACDPLKPTAPTGMGLTDVGPVAPPTYVLRRGAWQQKGREVTPGPLSAIGLPLTVPTPAPDARTTGRRSALAAWLTRPDHPLTARVLVNRLWQHHFGRGIVATPSDFGTQGDPPTHPELLDWLARTFIDRGWSLKAMHRLMVTSAAYRQSSQWDATAARVDPENRLLWRQNRTRLEGETLRDAMLSASGRLNDRAGGPSVYPELPADLGIAPARWPLSPPAERDRRSVYVVVKRNLRYPLFRVFDAPDGNETCARRYVTTQAPQALALLNDKVVLEQARALAQRVLHEAGPEPGAIVERAYRLTLARSPDSTERRTLLAFLDRETALHRQHLGAATPETDPAVMEAVVDLCHALFNLNEFMYLD